MLESRPSIHIDPQRLLLTAREASTAMAVCQKTLYSLTVPRGPIPAIRIGRAVRYDVNDLRNFIDQQRGQHSAAGLVEA